MSYVLSCYEYQGKDRKSDLPVFATLLAGADGLHPPLRGWPGPQRADPPDHVQVEGRTTNSEKHHWDTNGVSVETAGRAMQAGGRSQSSETDNDPNTADCHHGSAGALKQNEHKT